MQKILIIKLSSMGDLLHTLPALTDAKKAIPNIYFDWLSEPAFSEIPSWHPAVQNILLSPLRRWKKEKLAAYRSGEIKNFIMTLRNYQYDLIIDAQSALKTAILSRLARGHSAGMDKNSVREYGAHWLYQKSFAVNKEPHAITRLRLLFSQALNYSLDLSSEPDYGINLNLFKEPAVVLPENYVICIPNTTWKTKHWPEHHWQKLITKITQTYGPVLLMHGNDQEKERALRLAKDNHHVIVLPRLSLSECGFIISRAKAAVCVDTGLGHLCAALNIPAIHLYGPTDPAKIGAWGGDQIIVPALFPCAPCYLKRCNFKESTDGEPYCFNRLSVEYVWQQLLALLQ